jgi:hypothetical protein
MKPCVSVRALLIVETKVFPFGLAQPVVEYAEEASAKHMGQYAIFGSREAHTGSKTPGH